MSDVIYLDHAATAPMSAAALAAYTETLARTGNASALHSAGRAARRTLEESREQIAAALGARPSEVILTSGGTEADNLAIKGMFWARRSGERARRRLVISSVEHHAVLDPAFWMAQHEGAEIVLLPVLPDGRLNLDALQRELDEHADEIAVLSVMWANNEVGTVQPVSEIVGRAHRVGIPVHSDAVQAVALLDVDFAASGLDAMTVTAHKLGGPVGVGALVARRDLDLVPVVHGGGQERGVRSGTIDVAAARAFAVALDECVRERDIVRERVRALRDDLIGGVLSSVPGAHLRGVDPRSDPDGRLPGNAHLTFDGCEGDSLLYVLDSAGICASTGSACQAGVPQASHVLLAMGVDEVDAHGALRFSLGAASTNRDVEGLLAVLPEAVARARNAGLVSGRRHAGTVDPTHSPTPDEVF